jgi:hypothetical protein
MGFRDIHYFNLALLAKQVRHLFQGPESLCAKVQRAKYFPSGDLLNAELKKGISFTWQSIWHVIQTLKEVHIWQVRDGSSTNIWEDKWILNNDSWKVLSHRGQYMISKVGEFINPITNQWDEQLSDQTFWKIDEFRIKSIPLPRPNMPDFVAWNLTKKDIFSVRSSE